MNSLPTDLCLYICSHLNVASISNLLIVCTGLSLLRTHIRIKKSTRYHEYSNTIIKIRQIDRFNLIENHIITRGICIDPETGDQIYQRYEKKVDDFGMVKLILDCCDLVFVYIDKYCRSKVIIRPRYRPQLVDKYIFWVDITKDREDIFDIVTGFGEDDDTNIAELTDRLNKQCKIMGTVEACDSVDILTFVRMI